MAIYSRKTEQGYLCELTNRKTMIDFVSHETGKNKVYIDGKIKEGIKNGKIDFCGIVFCNNGKKYTVKRGYFKIKGNYKYYVEIS